MKQLPEWLEKFAAHQLSVEEQIETTASENCDEQEVAHVTESEQDALMDKLDTEGYGVENAGANPDEKHFQDGESASERAFDQANKRDMTTPEGRYAFDDEKLEKVAEEVASSIVNDVVSQALNPAEEMLNREVPLAQLANLVNEVKTALHANGIRRANFDSTMERTAEVINLNIPLEVTVGDPTSEGSAPAAPVADPMMDTVDDLGAAEEAPVEEMGDDMLAEADDMMMDDVLANNKKPNRFAKK